MGGVVHTPYMTPPTYTPVSTAKGAVRFLVGNRMGVCQGRGFALRCDRTGEWLSSDGETPSVWSTRAAAQMHADYPPTLGVHPRRTGGTFMWAHVPTAVVAA